MRSNQSISIVVPCYNEESRFPIEYWKSLISDTDVRWIFVDDGSTDSTLKILRELCIRNNFKNAEIVVCERNLGKGNAVRLGLLKSLRSDTNPRFLGFLDSDGAFSQHDVAKMINLAKFSNQKTIDKIYGAYILSRVALSGRAIHRKISRHYLGRVVATILSHKWREAPYDIQSGFKIFRNSEYLNASLQEPFMTRWFFDVELISRVGIARGQALEIWEEPASSWIDMKGSKLGYRNALSVVRQLIQARILVNRLRKSTI